MLILTQLSRNQEEYFEQKHAKHTNAAAVSTPQPHYFWNSNTWHFRRHVRRSKHGAYHGVGCVAIAGVRWTSRASAAPTSCGMRPCVSAPLVSVTPPQFYASASIVEVVFVTDIVRHAMIAGGDEAA